MPNRLIVNGKEVELEPNSVTLNFQINDLGDISTRNSTFSQSIKIPRTAVNDEILGYLPVIGSTSRVPYNNHRCTYIEDFLPLIVNGIFQVREVSDSYYTCGILDGLVELSNRIKDKTIDQTIINLTHTLDMPTVTGSFDNKEGFIYAVADFGKGLDSVVDISTQAPSIFLHSLFDAIFSSNGFTYTGDFFNNEDYRSDIISFSKGFYINPSAPTETDRIQGNLNSVSEYDTSTEQINFTEQFPLTQTGANTQFSKVGNGLVSGMDGAIVLRLDLDYSTYQTNANVSVKRNGSNVGTVYLLDDQSSKSQTFNINVETGDVLTFHLNANSNYYPTENETNRGFEISVSCSGTFDVNEISGGQTVYVNSWLGSKIKQIDLIKDVMQRYGLVVRLTGDNKTNYDFIQLETLLNDRKKAVDYSDRFDKLISQNYSVDYSQKNTASYVYGENVEVTHDGIFELDNEVVEGERQIFKSPYEISGGADFKDVPIWETKEDGTNLKMKEITNRIGRVEIVETTKSFIYSGVTATTSVSNWAKFTTDGLNLQTALNKYYQGFRNLLNTYKKVDVQFNLTDIDFVSIDFFRLIYLKQTQRYYYLQRIDNKGKATLLEINDFSVNKPVSQLGTYSLTMSYGSTARVTLEQLTEKTVPKYQDPEEDAPIKVKITSFGTSNIIIKQAGNTITTATEINVEDLDLTIEDDGTNTDAHTTDFTFQIMDSGSQSYGTETGKIAISVREYINYPPVARAGDDQSIILNGNDPYTNRGVTLNGSGSYDNTGNIVDYFWYFNSKPSGSTATINNGNRQTPNASLLLLNDAASAGTYSIRLLVTDNFGLSDADDMEVSVSYTESPSGGL